MRREFPIATATRDFVRNNGRWIGLAASLLAFATFAHAFSGILSIPDIGLMLSTHRLALLEALALYIASYIPMVVAWIILARACGVCAGAGSLTQVFLVSQIGKYLPGNVGHLIGRAYMTHRLGVPLPVAGTAMSLEVVGVLFAGAVFAIGAGFLSPAMTAYLTIPLAAGALGMAMLVALIFFARGRIRTLHELVGAAIAALGCYLVVFALLVAANVTLLQALNSNSSGAFFQIAVAVVLSWLTGFITPGAPAGLGVRELSLYALLAGAFPESSVLFAATAMRLATIAGDGIAWLVGIATGRYQEVRGALNGERI